MPNSPLSTPLQIHQSTDFGEFGAAIGVAAEIAEIGVRGEVDMATAPTLSAMLSALIDSGHTSIVVDLAAVRFMDAAGLGVLAEVAARLDRAGGVLLLRSVPVRVQLILDVVGMGKSLHTEVPPEGLRLGPEEVRGGEAFREGASDTSDLPATIASLAAPVESDTIDAALRLVVALASSAVSGADGVSVSLERHGRMMTAAASDDTVYQMDQSQYTTGQGPCLAAAAEGHWFHVEALANEKRWPDFVPQAIEEGIASILSSPLMTADRPIGALNIYSKVEGAFGPDEQKLAAVFAAHVSSLLVEARTDVSDDQARARIQHAMLLRTVIAHAEGILMERKGLPAEGASALLHRMSRAAENTVLEQAVDILRSSTSAGALPRLDHG